MIKQMVENETAADADWLIGEGCLLPGVKGVALRNMKEPGTAYNDVRFVSAFFSLFASPLKLFTSLSYPFPHGLIT
jgi:Zn-dependent metalloprotease